MDQPTDEAVAVLAERVSAIEQRLAERAAPVTSAGGFWALEELRRRTTQPAVVYAGVAHTAVGEPVEWQMGHDGSALLEEDWTAHAPALAALGQPTRLHILQLVARGEACTAAELALAEGLGTTGQIYHHLRQLVAGGWLRSTTKGRHEVPPERIVPLLVVLAASR